MKMQHTYGIYEDEIEPVVAAVRSHRSLAEIEAMPCPCCGAGLSVTFSSEGIGYTVSCKGEPMHMSVYQEIANPPPWWKKCVVEPYSTTFCWLDWHQFSEDGTLKMNLSGYGMDNNHWSGEMTLRPDEEDYPLWKWILSQRDRFKELLTDKDLEVLRAEYRGSTEHNP